MRQKSDFLLKYAGINAFSQFYVIHAMPAAPGGMKRIVLVIMKTQQYIEFQVRILRAVGYYRGHLADERIEFDRVLVRNGDKQLTFYVGEG